MSPVGLMGYAEARQRLLDLAAPLPASGQALAAAAFRVLAVDQRSTAPVPAFRNAALDGYAVHGADLTADTVTTLVLAGSTHAGQAAAATLARGQAMAIATGAPMPAGADRVVRVERSRLAPEDSRRVLLDAGTRAGANVRAAGSDYAPGDAVAVAGQRLAPALLMALAANGIASVPVHRPVRVAVLTTGDELGVGTAGRGGIHDANGPYLAALLAQAGAAVIGSESCGDRLDALAARITALRASADVVVTTGGVSAGPRDLVPAAVAAAGADLVFHKVAIRPGKPLLAARWPDGGWLLGLPGNPMAVAVGARFFLLPLLRALGGELPEQPLQGRTSGELRARPGLHFFGKGCATLVDDGRLTATLLPGQESFRIAPLAAANCWIAVPPEPSLVRAGEAVEIWPLDPGSNWLSR